MITLAGVFIPLLFAFLIASAFNGGFSELSDKAILTSNLFYGVI